jgi:hypothetical protein
MTQEMALQVDGNRLGRHSPWLPCTLHHKGSVNSLGRIAHQESTILRYSSMAPLDL